MSVSPRALTSFNMSSYRAIWTHFKQNFILFEPKISDPGPKILILVPKNIRSWSQGYMGETYFQEFGPRFFDMSSAGGYMDEKCFQEFGPDPGPKNIISWVHQIVFTGGLPPPRPPAVPGGLPAPQTP